MNFLQHIRYVLSEARLKKQMAVQPRKKAFLNFSDARSVAIIFDATPDGNLEQVKKLVNHLKEKKKQVKAVGFFDQKFTPVNISYAKADFDFFNLKELNPLNFPSSPYIRTFAEEQYDILIDLNLLNKFPLRSIAIISRASCKVGIDIPANQQIHDVFISMAPASGLTDFIPQVEKYLTMINR